MILKGVSMKHVKKLNLAVLVILLSCSSHYEKPVFAKRSVASFNFALEDNKATNAKMEKLIAGIFNSYLLGQVYLNEFDKELDKNPAKAMDTAAYSRLMAVRAAVDGFEDEINHTYVDLVIASGSSDYNETQKANAQSAIDSIGNFVAGVPSDKASIPENLKPMVLSNLMQKQTALFDELESIYKDPSNQGNTELLAAVHKNMVLLRASRLNEFKSLENYQVDPQVLKDAIAQQAKSKSFKSFEKEIQEQSKELRKYMKEVKTGRSTSSDAIAPSVDKSGNVTGSGYPANTWSITFDDGPASAYSPTVLKNLQAHNMKVTLFELAQQVKALPKIANAYKDAGMDMACHSYTHPNMPKVGPAQLEREITTAKAVNEQVLGIKMKLYRLPYGAGMNITRIRQKIAENNMIHVFWNVDTLDWQDKNPTSVFNRALKQMKGNRNKGIILFHDIHSQSVKASNLLMDHFVANKIKQCTVQATIDQMNGHRADCSE
jgi:peptidoglycan/xylan/chitin deacetylase (PgdA/CDA1 family)